ncbi:type III pantothenate kinase [bacterium]|nr:type III pantothenate kinase [bacterium]
MSDDTLFLKIGNSSAKYLYQGTVETIYDYALVSDLLPEVSRIVYYNTSAAPHNFKGLDSRVEVRQIKSTDKFSVTNGYAQPGLLGVDRILAASFFYSKHKEDFCCFDLGTAITASIVKNGILIGGAIIPGPDRVMKSTSTIGRMELPSSIFLTPFPGNDTRSNINAGLTLMYSGFFDKILHKYEEKIFVTGGDKRLLPLIKYDEYFENADLHEMERNGY